MIAAVLSLSSFSEEDRLVRREVKKLALYEVMYIVRPDVESEELLDSAIEKVNSTIENTGGNIVSQKKVGKRRLAYEIDDYKEGIYILINVQAEQSIVPVLEHFFKVNEGYLRYMILRLEEEKTPVEPSEEANTKSEAQGDDQDDAAEQDVDAVVEDAGEAGDVKSIEEKSE